MPIYEFECKICHHIEEILQKLNDPAPLKCPECEATHSMEKRMSQTSFQLKGGGWYNDLYSTPKAPAAETPKKTPDKATT